MAPIFLLRLQLSAVLFRLVGTCRYSKSHPHQDQQNGNDYASDWLRCFAKCNELIKMLHWTLQENPLADYPKSKHLDLSTSFTIPPVLPWADSALVTTPVPCPFNPAWPPAKPIEGASKSRTDAKIFFSHTPFVRPYPKEYQVILPKPVQNLYPNHHMPKLHKADGGHLPRSFLGDTLVKVSCSFILIFRFAFSFGVFVKFFSGRWKSLNVYNQHWENAKYQAQVPFSPFLPLVTAIRPTWRRLCLVRMYAILGQHEGIDNGTANQREHVEKNSNSRPE